MSDIIFDGKTEEQLWREYAKTKDRRIRDEFIRLYMPLVKKVAGRTAVKMNGNVEYDDLVGFGQFGLLDAIEKFDIDKKVKFITYATTRISGAIYDELRAIDWIPRSVRQTAHDLEETTAMLESKLGRAATEQEVADYMGISLEEYQKLLLKLSGTTVVSLDENWKSHDDGMKGSIGDNLESNPSQNPDALAEREAIRNLVNEAIRALPEKEQKVLILYYHEELTFKEIGLALGVSESRISQLHTKANLHLRTKLKDNARTSIF